LSVSPVKCGAGNAQVRTDEDGSLPDVQLRVGRLFTRRAAADRQRLFRPAHLPTGCARSTHS